MPWIRAKTYKDLAKASKARIPWPTSACGPETRIENLPKKIVDVVSRIKKPYLSYLGCDVTPSSIRHVEIWVERICRMANKWQPKWRLYRYRLSDKDKWRFTRSREEAANKSNEGMIVEEGRRLIVYEWKELDR